MKRLKRAILWLICCLLLTYITVFVGRHVLAHHRYRRHYAIAGYLEAMRHYYDLHEEVPASLEQLEFAYNGYDRRKVTIPTPPWNRRPSVFRERGSTGVERLILVEPVLSGLAESRRWVIFFDTDGSGAKMEYLPEDEIDGLLSGAEKLEM